MVGSMDKQGTKAFLERLYGGEVTATGGGGDEGGFYDEARAEGLRMLKQYGRPVKWRGFWSKLRLEGVGIHGETRDGFMLVLDEEASTRHEGVRPVIPPPVYDDPRVRLVEQADEHNAWGKKYDVIVFKLVKPSDVVRGLYVAHEGDVGGFDEEYWRAVYRSLGYLREGVIGKCLLPYLRLKGRGGSDLKLWDEIGKEGFRPAEAKPEGSLGERRKEQQIFLSTLEKEMHKSCLRCLLLAVERANSLFSKGYRYNVRGKWRMSSRLGASGRKALQRAARRFVKVKDRDGEE